MTIDKIKYVKELVNKGFESVQDPNEAKVINELFQTCFTTIENLNERLTEKNALLNLLKTASQIIESAESKNTS